MNSRYHLSYFLIYFPKHPNKLTNSETLQELRKLSKICYPAQRIEAYTSSENKDKEPVKIMECLNNVVIVILVSLLYVASSSELNSMILMSPRPEKYNLACLFQNEHQNAVLIHMKVPIFIMRPDLCKFSTITVVKAKVTCVPGLFYRESQCVKKNHSVLLIVQNCTI